MTKLKIGLLLTILSWIVSWGKLFPPLYQHTFFPLWLGYILVTNGLSDYLLNKSLMTRMKNQFWLLFAISVPFWWLFEGVNRSLNDWAYVFPSSIGKVEFFLRGSLNFSTVIPAVLSTVFLFLGVLNKVKKVEWIKLRISKYTTTIILEIGILFLAFVIFYPRFAFPLTWLSIFLIIDPINYKLKFPSVLNVIKKGDWSLVVAISLATLFTGFFWEMWNYYASPKWVYNIPFVEVYKIFEMPALGYIGYPFFGLEVYSYSNLVFGIARKYFPKLKLPLS